MRRGRDTGNTGLTSSSEDRLLSLEQFAAEREVAETRISTANRKRWDAISRLGMMYCLKWRSVGGMEWEIDRETGVMKSEMSHEGKLSVYQQLK